MATFVQSARILGAAFNFAYGFQLQLFTSLSRLLGTTTLFLLTRYYKVKHGSCEATQRIQELLWPRIMFGGTYAKLKVMKAYVLHKVIPFKEQVGFLPTNTKQCLYVYAGGLSIYFIIFFSPQFFCFGTSPCSCPVIRYYQRQKATCKR